MKKYSKTLLVLVVVIAAITSCGLIWNTKYPSGEWRYKMTVNIETPEGIVSGSAVREIHFQMGPKMLPDAHKNTAQLVGEAVIIDLGKRGIVFATLQSNQGINNSIYVPIIHYGWNNSGKAHSEKIDLTPDEYPPMVVFKDLSDPSTIKEVFRGDIKPENSPRRNEIYDQVKEGYFKEYFEENIRINSVTLEITSEPITKAIGKYLNWLPEYYGRQLDGNRYWDAYSKNPVASKYSSGSFQQEGK